MRKNQFYSAPSVEVVLLENADVVTISSLPTDRTSLREIVEGAGSHLNEFDY